jgi:nucleoid DNA-binding protein
MNVFVSCVEGTLLDNLDVNGFTIKLGGFGKFCVRHKHGTLRKIPFTGETKLTSDKRKIKFTSLGKLRECERVDGGISTAAFR